MIEYLSSNSHLPLLSVILMVMVFCSKTVSGGDSSLVMMYSKVKLLEGWIPSLLIVSIVNVVGKVGINGRKYPCIFM